MRIQKLLTGLCFASVLACGVSYAAPTAFTAKPATTTTTTQNLTVATTVIVTGSGSPQLGIQLGSPAQVQILSGSTVLTTLSLPAGVSYIDTSKFPAGTTRVNIVVNEGSLTFKISQDLTTSGPGVMSSSNS